MSGDNVDVARQAIDAWNVGDMERLRELYDPDAIVRLHQFDDWPEPGPFVGRDAIMQQFRLLRETFDTDTLNALTDFLAAGDRVVVRVAWKGAGHGPALNMETTLVYTIRRGLVNGLEYFRSHADALEAAGLQE